MARLCVFCLAALLTLRERLGVLLSDAAKDVSGQVFGTRMNELYLFSSSRPSRSVHHDGGWTPEQIAEIALPAFRSSFMPLDTSEQAFLWDPV